MNIQQQEKEKLQREVAMSYSMQELLAFHQSRYVVKRSGISQEDKDALKEQEEQMKKLFPPIKVERLKNTVRNLSRKEFRSIRNKFGKKAAIINRRRYAEVALD